MIEDSNIMPESFIVQTLQYCRSLSVYYNLKFVTLFLYLSICTKIDRIDILFHNSLNETWQMITYLENRICKILFEHRIPLKYFDLDVNYDFFYYRYDFNSCFYLYTSSDCLFNHSFISKMALYRLIVCHALLNKELLKICNCFNTENL
jgi:hypothetical protein